MTARRGARPRQSGQAMLLVALGGVALLAITGLAIDGGMAAGAFRHAQNAADAGALAAARQELVNAMANPPQPSTAPTLTPAAQAEVQHNRATLAGALTTATQTTYLPNVGGGLSATSALADVWAPAGPLLQPVNAHLELVGTSSSSTMRPVVDGGGSASAQVDIGMGEAYGGSPRGYASCWRGAATYTAGADTSASAVACPPGEMPTNVGAGGGMMTAPVTDAHVYADNHTVAAPRLQVSSVTGQDGIVALASVYAASGNTLRWDPIRGLVASAEMYASNVHAGLQGYFNIDAAIIAMSASVSVDAAGATQVRLTCTPAAVNITDTVLNVTSTINVDSSCSASGLHIAGISLPYVQPASGACSTGPGGVVSCSYQTCFLRVSLPTLPFATTLCLGEDNVSLGASPATTSQFTGSVSVGARVDQPTYFLGVLGWTHTTPTASASADVEAVVDESQAAFAASPFGMPDTATSMTAPFLTEHLTAGDTYYIYGPSMQSNNPSPRMPSGWQGQLDAASPHRVGSVVTGSGSLTTTPQPYLSNGPYWLLPIFNPVSLVVESWGVFVPVPGQPHWGKLVNSLPGKHGHVVQATSVPGWTTFAEGAVSIKLLQ